MPDAVLPGQTTPISGHRRRLRWIRWLLPLGFAVAATLVVMVLVRYPLSLARNGIEVAGVGVALVVLLGLAGWAVLRRALTADGMASRITRLGAGGGAVFGALWVVEIDYNNFIAPPISIRDPVDDIIWAGIALGMLVVASVAAARARSIGVGLRAGAWSGLISGLLACLMALGLVVFGMRFLLADPANQAEWAARDTTSGFADSAAYFAYQTLAGAMLHLIVLGIGMGTLLGLLGGLLGRALATRPRKAPDANMAL